MASYVRKKQTKQNHHGGGITITRTSSERVMSRSSKIFLSSDLSPFFNNNEPNVRIHPFPREFSELAKRDMSLSWSYPLLLQH